MINIPPANTAVILSRLSLQFSRKTPANLSNQDNTLDRGA
jgi:hypothetical protein